jgi:hypothetical protein
MENIIDIRYQWDYTLIVHITVDVCT